MKIILLIASFLLFLPQAASAQTPVAIDGLQVIAERQYATDPAATIDTSEGGVFLVSARVYLFDSPEDSDSTWATLVAAESMERDIPLDDDSITYEKTEMEDVGDRGMILSLTADIDDGQTGAFRTVLIQNGNMIVSVTAIAGSTDDATIADDIAAAMSEREPGDDVTEYDGTGASTGGVWDVFLPADAEELGDLQAYADKETRPAAS